MIAVWYELNIDIVGQYRPKKLIDILCGDVDWHDIELAWEDHSEHKTHWCHISDVLQHLARKATVGESQLGYCDDDIGSVPTYTQSSDISIILKMEMFDLVYLCLVIREK